MTLPHPLLRRLVLWPLPVVASLLYLTTVPLLLVAAAILSYNLPGKLRAVRALGLLSVYLFVEAMVMLVGLVLWIATGLGWQLRADWSQAAHHTLLRWALGLLVGAGRRLYELELDVDGEPLPAAGETPSPDDAPLVVMSRHAGPADSLLLLNEVMRWKGRRPRIVAKDLLQLDPAFDLLLNRLPNRFIAPNGGGAAVAAITELASGMTGRDAFVIFPEGGNFTPSRRVRAIDRLREVGDEAAAVRAERLRNVLPPRPAGSIAAMNAAPDADAVFVAHTGLDRIATLGDVWLNLPEANRLRVTWRRVDADDLPDDDVGKAELLMNAWETIDTWIGERRRRDGG